MSFITSFLASTPQSIYQGNISAPGTDIPIAPIDVSATILIASFASQDASGFPIGSGSLYLTLVNSVTARAVALAAGFGDVRFMVVEFKKSFLRSPVQYGSVNLSGSTSVSVTINPVGPKAIVIPLGFSEIASAGPQTDMATLTYSISLYSPTLVLATRYGTGGAAAPDVAMAGFCVLDPR